MSHPFNAFSSSGISSAALSAALAAKLDKAGGTITGNGAASTPPLRLNGTIFTGGTSTTTKPQLLIEPSGATSNNWSTNGSLIGLNAGSGFTGLLIDAQTNGSGRFSVDGSTGAIRLNGDTKDTIWRRTDVDLLIFQGGNSQRSTGVGYTGGLAGLSFGVQCSIRWTNDTPASTPELILSRAAAASLQLGSNHDTTPTSQTIKAHNVTTGTGADLVLTGGTGSVNNGMVKLSNASGEVRMSVGDAGVGFFTTAPQPQATTSGIGSPHYPGSGTGVTDDSTFDGYTIGQIVSGLRSFGLFA